MHTSLIIGSGKGGVGKTSTAVNLGVALSLLGKKTILVDSNLPAPNVGLHLGIPFDAKTLNHIIKHDAAVEEATFIHRSGLKVIPAGFKVASLHGLEPDKIAGVLDHIKKVNDFTIIDCAPGLGVEVINSLRSADRMMVVTNPEIPSVADASKTVQIAQDIGVNVVGVLLNRVGRFKHELTEAEIQAVIEDLPVLGRIPEDKHVPSAISHAEPVVTMYPNSPSSHAYKKMASSMLGLPYQERRGLGAMFRSVFRK